MRGTQLHRRPPVPQPMNSHFDIPLDLPHAATIVDRIERLLERRLDREDEDHDEAFATVALLRQMLASSRASGENPPAPQDRDLAERAAAQGRELVAEIERLGIREDRLGQCIRNLFECLAMGREGAEISLRAGEDPRSPMRP